MKLILILFNLIITKVLFLIVILNNNNLCDSKICHDVDIRNDVKNFNRLTNCTIVTGFLQLVLINANVSDFKGLRFDSLREVSGFLMVYKVIGLKSLTQLFPNLIVIRGIHLFVEKYAFVIYENKDFEEIGLKSLIQIQRGFVRIQNNPQLCFTDTILWKNLTTVGVANLIDPVNPKKCSSACRGCDGPACWSVKYCQRFDTPYNRTGTIKCHPNCLGGCYNKTDKGCIVCRNITRDDGRCVNKCEAPRMINTDDNHCLYPNTCLQRGRIIFNKRCLAECPTGYIIRNVYDADRKTTTKTCLLCSGNCTITCNGTEVDSLYSARKLQGCTIINGTLNIRINTDVPSMELLEDLELYLGEIEEITNYLKVYRSIALTRLSFFKNLRLIHGVEQESGKYGLIIYNNPNLKTLWDWQQKPELTILNGGMSISFNDKLCMTEINKLQQITKYSNENDSIYHATNGNQQSCNVIPIFGEVKLRTSHNVTFEWVEFKSKDPNYILLGYDISYIETEWNNITTQYGEDVCSKFSWQTILITVGALFRYQGRHQYTITNLKPFTHYGIYVKSVSAENKNSSIADGQTAIRYFTTLMAAPKIPVIGTASKTPNSLQIRWVIDENDNDLIDYFNISLLYHEDEKEFLDQRDFCQDHQVNGSKEISPLDLLSCCMKEDENLPYEDVAEIGLSYQTGTLPTCFEAPTAECHHLPYAPDKFPQSDSYYNYNNYYNNIDYEFRNVMFKYAGLINSLRSNIEYSRIIRNYTVKGSNHNNFNITRLRPFGMYTVIMIACNKLDQCSPFYMHSDRTAPLYSNDAIEFQLTQTFDSIILYFAPPPNPNGVTIAFHIDCLIINDKKQEGTLCVTRKEHEMNNFTFTFSDLPNGTYAMRVRSLSLAGSGAFSEWKLFEVHHSDTTLQHTLTFSFIAVLIIIILILVYKYYLVRHCFKSRSKIDDRVNLISMEYKPAEDTVTWHLNYDSDESEFSGFSAGLNRSSSAEDPEPEPSNPFDRIASTAHTEHERLTM